MRARGGVLQSILAAALVFTLFPADGVRGNEWSAGVKFDTNDFDGLKGNQGIRTDPTCSSGISYVHPTQLDVGSLGGDFIAIGTKKCEGTSGPGHAHDCADDFDSKWDIYVDYIIGGVYSCWDIATDVYAVGANPSFEISYTFCAPSGPTEWVLFFGGVQRKCVSSGQAYGSGIVIGIETAGTTVDKNIDVKYTNLYRHLDWTTGWLSFGNCSLSPSYADPNYSIAYVSSTACNTYLAPLD